MKSSASKVLALTMLILWTALTVPVSAENVAMLATTDALSSSGVGAITSINDGLHLSTCFSTQAEINPWVGFRFSQSTRVRSVLVIADEADLQGLDGSDIKVGTSSVVGNAKRCYAFVSDGGFYDCDLQGTYLFLERYTDA